MISAPGVAAGLAAPPAPPAISDSLLARARRRPALRAARVTGSPAKPTTPLTTTSATVAMCGQSLGPGHHLHTGGKASGQLAGQRGIADGHDLGMEAAGLVGQELDRALGADGYHRESVGAGIHHIDGLGPDRSSGSDQTDTRGGWHPPSLPEIQPRLKARTR